MKSARIRQTLCGTWDYRIGEGDFVKKQIPYSDAPVGVSECRLCFDAAHAGSEKRAFLVLEGITYEADVTLNGIFLGKMLPYCEYRFEVTELLTPRDNCLSVVIRDTEIVFGAGEGWENYSGITRAVYLEYTAPTLLENVFWHATVEQDLHTASCTAEIATDGCTEGTHLTLTLLDPSGNTAYTQSQPVLLDRTTLCFTLSAPALWSPDAPVLYTLTLTLSNENAVLDTYTTAIGFKRFETRGRRFYLNGKPFFVFGVCRHELWGEQGHLVSDAQIEADLRMIKETGCNYVRLVHYPHRSITLDIADRLGLLVSEEPGLWWSDMSDPAIVEASLEVLRRTVIRDRNHVSVAFWLSFNECIFTPEYLKRSGEVCRALDPYRMVSGANCMDIPMTQQYFAECGFDFYTMHPYHYKPTKMTESAEQLTALPLLFTEWGGYHVYDNPFLMKHFITEIRRLWQTEQLAGACYWCWSEIYEFNRAAPACHNGLQREGLVNRFRTPNLSYATFREEFAKLNSKEEPTHTLTTEFFEAEGDFFTVSLAEAASTPQQQQAYDRMLRLAAKPIPRFYYESRNTRRMAKGPALPARISALGHLPVELEGRPAVIEAGSSLDIPVGAAALRLHLIGVTSMPKGFPIGGAYGELVGEVKLCYEDGSSDTLPLRNGYEVTTATAWYGPSRINPRAANAARALHFVHDMDREQYVANLLTLTPDPTRSLRKLTVSTVGEGYCLLLYGVTVQAT